LIHSLLLAEIFRKLLSSTEGEDGRSHTTQGTICLKRTTFFRRVAAPRGNSRTKSIACSSSSFRLIQPDSSSFAILDN